MKSKVNLIIFLLVIINATVISQSNLIVVNIGELELQSGKTIICNIGYRTFGNINSDSSNVIIYPTWFGGTSEGISNLIENINFVDTTKYFIIAIDALGNGVSSAPSNYKSENTFPEITIRDMVNSQYKFLKEIIGLNHLYGAIGGSMGSMQVLEWSVAHPNFIDKIVAYVSSPKMTSYDLLWMNTQLNFIESSRKQGMSDREIKKISEMITAMIARTPSYVVENTRLKNFSDYLTSFDKEPSKIFTLDNYLAQLKAMMKHDISINFNNSLEEAAENIKAELFIIISETDMMVNPTETKKLAKLTNAKTLFLNNNCGHLAVSCEIEKCRTEIAKFFDK
jgi:homoserine O-acetyltransferase